jgi:hypothetical protein
MLKGSAYNELFTQKIPDVREMLDPYIAENEENLSGMMINIGSDHYSKNNSKKYYSEDNTYGSNSNQNTNSHINSYDEGNKFSSISSNYKNNSRFASISSEPYNPEEHQTEPKSEASSFFSFVGSALSKTKELAGTVGQSVYNMGLGGKILYGGAVALEAVKYTGSKVYEKSSDFAVRNFLNL